MAFEARSPFQLFVDAVGKPLNSGALYVGVANLPAETNPLQVYWDEAGTIPALQPLAVSGGYVVRNGSPARIYTTADDYSMTLKTDRGITVWSELSVTSALNLRNELASQSGSSMIGFIQSGLGANVTTVQTKLRESVSIKDFGAVGDGVTDDTAAIQEAIDSLGAAGGKVIVTNGMRCLIDNNLTIKPNVSLVGPHTFVGSPQDNASAAYGSVGGSLIVNSSATITLLGGASAKGFLVYRKGMTFPTSDSSAFAGTAFIAGDDDVGVSSCLVMGFDTAFSSVGQQRPKLDYFYFDCINGVYIENCLDNPKISKCHGWPFSGIAFPSKPSNWADRSGVAFHFKDTADWLTLPECFSYGYYRGTKIENCNHYLLIGPQADGTGTYSGSIGIEIDGTAGGCEEGMIIAPRVAAQVAGGIRIQTLTGIPTTIVSGGVWQSGTHGVLLVSGDLHISDTVLRSVSNGLTVNSSDSKVFRRNVRFDSVTLPLNITTSNSKIYGGDDDLDLLPGNSATGSGTNMVTESLPSSSPLNLPSTGNVFNVTGTTSFGTLNGGWKGRTVTMIFDSSLSVFSSTGSLSAMRLSGGGTFNAVANSTLTLHHNGVQWYEISRSA